MKEGELRVLLTIFAGRFGSGKTEAALNYALRLAQRKKSDESGAASSVTLIDLDIVTPYFRSREMADRMQQEGVQVIAPAAVSQHLDTPGITPQILGAIQRMDVPVVLDVGGDRQGARALGQFSSAIQRRGYTLHFVVNPYRPFTDSLDGLSISIAEIESSSRLRVQSLISNPNLIAATTIETILEGHSEIESYARTLGLPVAFVCIERRWMDLIGPEQFAQPLLILDRHFVMTWE
jgi:hypothetical protein